MLSGFGVYRRFPFTMSRASVGFYGVTIKGYCCRLQGLNKHRSLTQTLKPRKVKRTRRDAVTESMMAFVEIMLVMMVLIMLFTKASVMVEQPETPETLSAMSPMYPKSPKGFLTETRALRK